MTTNSMNGGPKQKNDDPRPAEAATERQPDELSIRIVSVHMRSTICLVLLKSGKARASVDELTQFLEYKPGAKAPSNPILKAIAESIDSKGLSTEEVIEAIKANLRSKAENWLELLSSGKHVRPEDLEKLLDKDLSNRFPDFERNETRLLFDLKRLTNLDIISMSEIEHAARSAVKTIKRLELLQVVLDERIHNSKILPSSQEIEEAVNNGVLSRNEILMQLKIADLVIFAETNRKNISERFIKTTKEVIKQLQSALLASGNLPKKYATKGLEKLKNEHLRERRLGAGGSKEERELIEKLKKTNDDFIAIFSKE